MKHFLVLFTLLFSQYQSLPIPTGQIIKYRVSSKYFNRPNDTSSSTDNSLYQLLSQMHYGTKEPSITEAPTVENEKVTTTADKLHLEDISNDNKNNDGDVTTVINSITNEYPEVIFFSIPNYVCYFQRIYSKMPSSRILSTKMDFAFIFS